VLEIGTGSGYNAALLSDRLTSSQVATVEVDPVVAEAARTALRECGLAPTVAVADGAAGHPAGSPYDRLIATCSVPDIPAAWIAQMRQDGMILASLHRDLGGGPLVLLRVDGPGRAEGRFLPTYGSFMSVRTSPPADPAARLAVALATEPAGAAARAAVVSAEVLESKDFGMIAALRLPGVASIGFEPDTGPQRWLLADDGSWARFDELTGAVFQHGARRLWDEVEDVHDQWVQLGRPARGRIGLTVTDAGEHRFWVDNRHGVWWTQGQAVSPRCRTGG
jgi:protein-L-isoaspartate(D-aspartate) O-methyltransferase